MTNHIPSDIVPLAELARHLKLSKAWLHQQVNAGRIPFIRAGKQRIFNPAAVEAALAKRAASGDDGAKGGAA